MAEMNQTPKGSRIHIGLFGRRNAGKSSLINALTKQNIALVSETAGTTTDPVYKAMEMLPLGPVMLIDTAGIDDVGDLGKLRIGKTKEVIAKTDVALIVVDIAQGISAFEKTLTQTFRKNEIPYLWVINKADTSEQVEQDFHRLQSEVKEPCFLVSSTEKSGLEALRNKIVEIAPRAFEDRPLLRDLLNPGETVVFCVPIDTAAPKGRLILPQVQAIRDTLDANASALTVKENHLQEQLDNLKEPPSIVVTDSQVFAQAASIVPKEIPLTSFSILMARRKGDLQELVEGAFQIDRLKPGDKILIAEACTHQCQAEDIGRVKIPKWLSERLGGPLNIEWYTGDSFPDEVHGYQMVIHCGACMINRRAMLSRQRRCKEAGVPIVNYGVLIAYIKGILPRVLSPFPEIDVKQ